MPFDLLVVIVDHQVAGLRAAPAVDAERLDVEALPDGRPPPVEEVVDARYRLHGRSWKHASTSFASARSSHAL